MNSGVVKLVAVELLSVFFQAEDGIRDWSVTGVQTCALPIYSFHDSVKAKIPAERMPGTASGKLILTMARMRLAPSIRAHSSISRGMVLKYPIKSHVQKGMRNVG